MKTSNSVQLHVPKYVTAFVFLSIRSWHSHADLNPTEHDRSLQCFILRLLVDMKLDHHKTSSFVWLVSYHRHQKVVKVGGK